MGYNVFGAANVDFDNTPGPSLVHIGPVNVHDIAAVNNSTAAAYLQIFDLGRTPILGTDIPVIQFLIPFATVAGQLTPPLAIGMRDGVNLQQGFAYGVTTTRGGSTAVAAHVVTGSVSWKPSS